VGSACSTSTGSYDNLEEIGHFCQQNNLWFHVDGAHGSAVAFSKKYKHRVKGIELADSVVTDFHKLLMTPGLATAVIYKNGMHAFNTFRQDAQYLWNNVAITDHYNFGKKTFECTKLMMGVKIFSILHQYGLQVFEDYIDTVQQNAEVFADAVAAHPSFELALPPQSNIVCFRYAHGIKNEEEANRLNRAIRTQLLANGKFFIVQTTIKGKIYLRVSLMNPFTSLPDMLGLLKEAAEIGNAEKLA
jgi:L-2,4-diaminobutyrate decarboxylase